MKIIFEFGYYCVLSPVILDLWWDKKVEKKTQIKPIKRAKYPSHHCMCFCYFEETVLIKILFDVFTTFCFISSKKMYFHKKYDAMYGL